MPSCKHCGCRIEHGNCVGCRTEDMKYYFSKDVINPWEDDSIFIHAGTQATDLMLHAIHDEGIDLVEINGIDRILYNLNDADRTIAIADKK